MAAAGLYVSEIVTSVTMELPGFGLSPYLFLLLMDVLTQDVRKDVPGSMMFADDIVLCGDDRVLGDLEEGIRGERDEEQQT